MDALTQVAGRSYFVSYDALGDVVYVNNGNSRAAKTKADDDGFLWRYGDNRSEIIGFTIEDFLSRFEHDIAPLAKRLSDHLRHDERELLKIATDMIRVAEHTEMPTLPVRER